VARKSVKKPLLPKDILDDLVGGRPQEGPSFLARLKMPDRKRSPMRVERPVLPKYRRLTVLEQWTSLRWIIDTAETHGTHALRGLTVALSRMIQAQAFETLLMDARPFREPLGNVEQLLWDESQPVAKDGRRLADLMSRRRVRDRINLTATAVIAKIWEPWRLARALQNLGPGLGWGPWRQDNNHHAVAWHPWPLVWVYNGNHSVATATLRGGGELKCEASFDASPLLRLVTTDGESWFGEDRRVLGPVRSLPMAGIVEIGRRLTRSKAQSRGGRAGGSRR
jgi:hypothetical protein